MSIDHGVISQYSEPEYIYMNITPLCGMSALTSSQLAVFGIEDESSATVMLQIESEPNILRREYLRPG